MRSDQRPLLMPCRKIALVLQSEYNGSGRREKRGAEKQV